MKRLGWIDGIRFVATIWVIGTHYLSIFWKNIYLYVWHNTIFVGITGKLCVAIFAVIMGNFACAKGEKAEDNTQVVSYIIKRWVTFSAWMFFSNFILAFSFDLSLDTVWNCIKSGILLDENAFSIGLWYFRPFLFGSVICFLNGKYQTNILERVILVLLFFLLDEVWIAIALLGSIVNPIERLCEKKKVTYRKVIVLLWFCLFILISREESNIVFMLDGIWFLLTWILLVLYPKLNKFLEFKIVGKYREKYMAYMVVQWFVLLRVMRVYRLNNLIVDFIYCLFTILIFSSIADRIIGWGISKINAFIDRKLFD